MHDAIVVGSGAGGAPLAWALSAAGFTVLVLEKGPDLDAGGYAHDEPSASVRGAGFLPSVDDEPHVLEDLSAATPPRRTTLGWIASCVGGGTSHMGGTFARFHPDDFRVVSRLGPFLECVNWPFGYDELEPYYSQAEQIVGVSGLAGANPHEGLRTRGYPMPPLASNAIASAFEAACRRRGLAAFPTPRAINSMPWGGRPACSHCDLCAGFGCPSKARGSMSNTFLDMAKRTGRCEVRPRSAVAAIAIDRAGRALGCDYVDAAGALHRVEASVVVVAASAIESARLLLLSTSSRFPHGVGNDAGLVGRHLQMHCSSTGRARFRRDRSDLVLSDRNPFMNRSLMDHYFLPPGTSAWPKGGYYRFDMEALWPIRVARQVAFNGPDGAVWGTPLKRKLREHFLETRGIDFEVFHDFVPNDRTRVSLDPETKDKWGLPVARMQVWEPEHHRAAGNWLVQRGLEILSDMGAESLRVAGAGYINWVMTHGTCRAGSEPSTSVLDPFCRIHAVPNAFVVDGSFMPTSGGAPSTLTIIANSLRTAAHIIARARTRDFG